jgi:hypothetical protein
MIWVVIWVVLMMFWLAFGCYSGYEPARPYLLGNTFIPWLCVLIIGLVVFGAVAPGPIRF